MLKRVFFFFLLCGLSGVMGEEATVPEVPPSPSPSHDTEGMDSIERQKYEPRVSNKWFRGSYLIYDCEKANFACVNQVGWDLCHEQREDDKKQSKFQLRCAPFKMFATQEKCFAEQYRQVQNKKPPLYCTNPKFY